MAQLGGMNGNVEDIAFQTGSVNVQKEMAKMPYDPRTSYHKSDEVYMAVASDIAYKHRIHLKADPKTADIKTNKLIQSRMQGHNLMNMYSNENQVVIRRPDDSIIFAVRGTDPTNPLDLYNDALIASGTMSSAPVSRLKEVEKVFKKLPKDVEVTLSGHSLGADIARRIGEKYNKRSVTFSTPAVYPSIGSSGNTSFLTNKFDLVSSGNKYFNFSDNLEVLPQISTKPLIASHDISNFLPPDSMYPLRHSVAKYPKSIQFPIKHSVKFEKSHFKQNVNAEITSIPIGVNNELVKKKKKKSTLDDKDGDVE